MVTPRRGGRGGRRADAPLDILTDVDDLLRDQVVPSQNRLADTLDSIDETLARLEEGPGREGILEHEEYPLELSKNVPANTTEANAVHSDYEMEFDAEITGVIIGFPDGTQNAVPMNFGLKSGQRFIPFNEEERWIAFQAFTYEFRVRTTVEEGEILRASYFNLTNNDKFVNCAPLIREL